MLFSINEDLLLDDYFNISNDKDNIMSPKQGLKLGNMFNDEYIPYKNYMPKIMEPSNEKESALQRIRELSFAVNDLNLKLDVEPYNKNLYGLFKKYAEELNELVMNYSKRYGALEICDDVNGTYTWYKNPWPWEGNGNV